VLEDVLNAFHRQAALNHVRVERKIATDGMVLAFPVELRQIFVNLIANALQAMPDGGELRVSLRPHSAGKQGSARPGIQIRVTDTGAGIPVQHQDKIFQPFFTTKSDKGTGLGLWVSSGIVQKLNGTIHFRCIKWHRKAMTSFSVFIPTDGSGVSIA
jgi:signal transduction histidine kinase